MAGKSKKLRLREAQVDLLLKFAKSTGIRVERMEESGEVDEEKRKEMEHDIQIALRAITNLQRTLPDWRRKTKKVDGMALNDALMAVEKKRERAREEFGGDE